jgi:hypothetical protein
MGLAPRLSRAAFLLAAWPVVVRAALRVARRLEAGRLEAIPGELRRVPPFRWRWLARPDWLDGVLVRLLPLLPPRRAGRCLKRSLMLLDLWSRCGVESTLHLGVRRPGQGALEGHAWVSTGRPALDRRTGPEGWEEMWRG